MNTKTKSNERLIVGMDLGGTKLAAAMFRSLNGDVHFLHAVENLRYKTIFTEWEKSGLTAEGKSRIIEEAMVRAVTSLCRTAGVERPAAIGVASAGFIENDMVVEAMNTGMKNYPLKARIQSATGADTFLYKDSWAPIYALAPEEPCIIFSIGTGFGGVSCETSLKVSLRSRSARRRVVWIPYLYFNDDPGYAATFSQDDIAALISRGFRRCADLFSLDIEPYKQQVKELAARVMQYARDDGKVSPSGMEILIARALAYRAAHRIRPNEVFADSVCAAPFPGLIYQALTGNEIAPQDLDGLLAEQDTAARLAFLAQAEFIGEILARMQHERVENGLAPAKRVCGTGSGFNSANRELLGPAIISVMKNRGAALGLTLDAPDDVELMACPEGDTTLACFGAAVGAARGIVQL